MNFFLFWTKKSETWLMRLNLCMIQIKIKHGQGPNCYGINAFYKSTSSMCTICQVAYKGITLLISLCIISSCKLWFFSSFLEKKKETWLMRLNLCMVHIKIKQKKGPNCYGINALYNQKTDDELQMYITNKLGNTAANSN